MLPLGRPGKVAEGRGGGQVPGFQVVKLAVTHAEVRPAEEDSAAVPGGRLRRTELASSQLLSANN